MCGVVVVDGIVSDDEFWMFDCGGICVICFNFSYLGVMIFDMLVLFVVCIVNFGWYIELVV